MIVGFIDIDGIISHQRINILFIMNSGKNSHAITIQKKNTDRTLNCSGFLRLYGQIKFYKCQFISLHIGHVKIIELITYTSNAASCFI